MSLLLVQHLRSMAVISTEQTCNVEIHTSPSTVLGQFENSMFDPCIFQSHLAYMPFALQKDDSGQYSEFFQGDFLKECQHFIFQSRRFSFLLTSGSCLVLCACC